MINVTTFLDANSCRLDKPVYYSQLKKSGATRAQLAKQLLERCNELGKMQFDDTMDVTIK